MSGDSKIGTKTANPAAAPGDKGAAVSAAPAPLDGIVLGRAGNDTITAGLGADLVFGGTGNDRILAGDGGDPFKGFDPNFNNVVSGGSGGDDWDTLDLRGTAGDGRLRIVDLRPDSDGNGFDGRVV